MITVNYSNGLLSEAHPIGPEILAESSREDLISIICKEPFDGSVDQIKNMVCDFINSKLNGWGSVITHENAFLGTKEPDHDERYVCMLSFSVDKIFDLQHTIYNSSVLRNLEYCRYPWIDIDDDNKRYADSIDAVKWLKEAHGIDISFHGLPNDIMEWEASCPDEKQNVYKTKGTSPKNRAVEDAIMGATEKFKQLDN